MFKNKLKKIIGNDENQGNNKRKIENLVFLVVVLIITVVIINYVWSGDKNSNKNMTNSTGKQLATTKSVQNSGETSQDTTNNNLEERLENILSNINGVGNVKVFINYSETSETVAMYNENSKVSQTEETDTSGGKRVIESTDSQKDIVFKEENGEKIPITQKIIQPKIEGAIITAQGANDATTKSNIMQAVEAATGIATHKIQVFEMN